MIIKITQRDHDDDEMMPIKGFQGLLQISPLSSVYCRRGEPSHLWPFYHREDLEDASDADGHLLSFCKHDWLLFFSLQTLKQFKYFQLKKKILPKTLNWTIQA